MCVRRLVLPQLRRAAATSSRPRVATDGELSSSAAKRPCKASGGAAGCAVLPPSPAHGLGGCDSAYACSPASVSPVPSPLPAPPRPRPCPSGSKFGVTTATVPVRFTPNVGICAFGVEYLVSLLRTFNGFAYSLSIYDNRHKRTEQPSGSAQTHRVSSSSASLLPCHVHHLSPALVPAPPLRLAPSRRWPKFVPDFWTNLYVSAGKCTIPCDHSESHMLSFLSRRKGKPRETRARSSTVTWTLPTCGRSSIWTMTTTAPSRSAPPRSRQCQHRLALGCEEDRSFG